MLVSLRDVLPSGFKPADVDRRYLYNQKLSLEGVRAIGDRQGLLPDIDRTIKYVRDRLIVSPELSEVSSADIAGALKIAESRALAVLELVASLGQFASGGVQSPLGFTQLHLGGDDVVAGYLAYRDLNAFLALRDQRSETGKQSPARSRANPTRSAAAVTNSVFILMSMDPSDPTLVDVMNTIKEECAAFGLAARRVDDIEHQDRITDMILENIQESQFIIADLSGERPNVYYEVGFAHALGKHPILIRRKATPLHFDLSVHNVPEYSNMTELHSLLRKRLEAILGRSPRLGGATFVESRSSDPENPEVGRMWLRTDLP